jgi:hypothetical protein
MVDHPDSGDRLYLCICRGNLHWLRLPSQLLARSFFTRPHRSRLFGAITHGKRARTTGLDHRGLALVEMLAKAVTTAAAIRRGRRRLSACWRALRGDPHCVSAKKILTG